MTIDRKPIMLEIAEATQEQKMWERRFYQFCKSYPSWRSADEDGPWGLRDLLVYIAPICGFDPAKVREP